MKLPAISTAIAIAMAAGTAGSACRSAPPPQRPTTLGSRGMRADQHLDEAREHDRRAKELARWPETRPGGIGAFDDSHSGLWYRRWDTASEEAKLAESHRSAAADLHAKYDEACGDTPADQVAVSPLARHGVGGTNVADGVLIFFRPEAGTPDALLRELRCHRAWMMLGEAGMEECPLDLAGIQIVAHGDPSGISVQITAQDPRVVAELQRRTARDLEAAQHRERPPTRPAAAAVAPATPAAAR